MKSPVLILIICMLCPGHCESLYAQVAESPSREAKRTYVTTTVRRVYKTVQQLTAQAETIVLVRITGTSVSALARELPSSNVSVMVLKTIKPAKTQGLFDGNALSVFRPGEGSVKTSEGEIVAHQEGVPPFVAGREYVLFLCDSRGQRGYQVCGGPQGAWQVESTRVEPLHRFRKANDAYKTVDSLVAAIQQAHLQSSGLLTEADVGALIEGQSNQGRVATYVREHGVSFSVTPEIERKLVSLGASPELIREIASANR